MNKETKKYIEDITKNCNNLQERFDFIERQLVKKVEAIKELEKDRDTLLKALRLSYEKN